LLGPKDTPIARKNGDLATSDKKEKEDVPYPPYHVVASIYYHMFVGL
jgi:hypothetical protein